MRWAAASERAAVVPAAPRLRTTHSTCSICFESTKRAAAMTQHLYLCVPYAERALARDLGCSWCPRARRWFCNTTQFRSRSFKRWRDKSQWRRITIHPDDTKQDIQEAKRRGCTWDPATRTWCLDVTGDDTLKSWHRARMTPPPTHELRIAFEERLAAKEHGARWDAV